MTDNKETIKFNERRHIRKSTGGLREAMGDLADACGLAFLGSSSNDDKEVYAVLTDTNPYTSDPNKIGFHSTLVVLTEQLNRQLEELEEMLDQIGTRLSPAFSNEGSSDPKTIYFLIGMAVKKASSMDIGGVPNRDITLRALLGLRRYIQLKGYMVLYDMIPDPGDKVIPNKNSCDCKDA